MGILILPHAVTILTGFIPQTEVTAGFIDASPYLSFVMRIILVFGLAFLLPEVMVALNHLGLVKGTTLLKGWRWAVVIIFAFMAVANPPARPLVDDLHGTPHHRPVLPGLLPRHPP